MVLGASPQDSSPPENGKVPPFGHVPFGSTSPPQNGGQGRYMSPSDAFSPATLHQPQLFSFSPATERKTNDPMSPSMLFRTESEQQFGMTEVAVSPTTVIIRRLPRNTSPESLRSMLLFAKDLIDTEFVASEQSDDKNFVAAVARFGTAGGAQEACERLHGKPNLANETNMIVEILPTSLGNLPVTRRYTMDNGPQPRAPTLPIGAMSPTIPASNRQPSRFNSTFQSIDKVSPPNKAPGMTNGEFPAPDGNTSFSTLFSPQSPLANGPDERHRVSGKSVINDETADDETGELLKDPVAYAQTGQASLPMAPMSQTQQIPITRFGNLSLNTDGASAKIGSPPLQGYTSPRGGAPLKSPVTAVSPTSLTSAGPNGGYQMMAQHYQRHNYPPVNPADQNPPCNTLYVGNLPMDTSEDELKAMFSKQRGYKRLCFRTKQNGPMCFVEFEDISFATKALNELYGHPLHNSVKGGIRLSFSKNPLGVRGSQNNQAGGMGGHNGMSPMGNGMNGPAAFAVANGPPPGLSAPPGLSPQPNMTNNGFGGMGFPNVFGSPTFGGMSPPAMNSSMRTQSMPAGPPQAAAGPGPNYVGLGLGFNDYMMGR